MPIPGLTLIIMNRDLEAVGIVTDISSFIWHSKYYTPGDFEIYVEATSANKQILLKDYYIKPNTGTDDIGVIEDIKIEYKQDSGYMMTVTGRYLKSLLDRRLIYALSGNTVTPETISGKVEVAARKLVADNAISCTFDTRRNMPALRLGTLKNLSPVIVDEHGDPAERQVSCENLLTYTDSLLKEYGMAAKMIINYSTDKINYVVYMGSDRSADNTEGNTPVIFSTDYGNLNSCTYDSNGINEKNAALIGGEGQGIDRFYSLLRGTESGNDLREMFVDASSVNRKYQETYEENESLTVVSALTSVKYDKAEVIITAEKEYSAAQYSTLLNQKGRTELDKHTVTETFSGDILPSSGQWIYGTDYFLGDIVTVSDSRIGKTADKRITEVTEVWDADGHTVNTVFGE